MYLKAADKYAQQPYLFCMKGLGLKSSDQEVF